MKVLRAAVLFVIAALAPLAARAAGAVFASGERPAHFLEVYTSEGCSSCPPAEDWLGVLKTQPDLWTDFVPVAWHVDYWDKIGWKDGVGSRDNSIRQKTEAGQANASSYTPGFFLNGAEWKGWFDGRPLPPADAPAAGVLRATQVGDREFVVEFMPAGPDTKDMDVGAALLGMGITATPTAGENRNKHLVHDFAALASDTQRASLSGGKYTAHFELRTALNVVPERLAVAFWVAPAGTFKARQATGGFLAPDTPLHGPDPDHVLGR